MVQMKLCLSRLERSQPGNSISGDWKGRVHRARSGFDYYYYSTTTILEKTGKWYQTWNEQLHCSYCDTVDDGMLYSHKRFFFLVIITIWMKSYDFFFPLSHFALQNNLNEYVHWIEMSCALVVCRSRSLCWASAAREWTWTVCSSILYIYVVRAMSCMCVGIG